MTEKLLAALAWCDPAPGWHGLEAELQFTITRQTSKTPQPGARATDTPVPFNVAASDAAGFLRWLLGSWVDTLLRPPTPYRVWLSKDPDPETYPGDFPPHNTITECAAWLVDHIGRINLHDARQDIETELCDAIHRALNSLDARTARHYAGPCPGCGRDMYTHTGGDTAECRTCDTTHDGVEAWRTGKVDDARRTPLTRGQILVALPAVYAIQLPAKTFDSWVHRRKLTPTYVVNLVKGPNPARYTVADVETLMQEQAARDERKTIR